MNRTKTKEQYDAPQCEEQEIRLEVMIALSGGEFPSWEPDDTL